MRAQLLFHRSPRSEEAAYSSTAGRSGARAQGRSNRLTPGPRLRMIPRPAVEAPREARAGRGEKEEHMAQYTPPPATGPVRGQRPGPVTAASVLLFVDGGLAILGALVLFALSSLGLIFTLIAILYLVVGALAIYAGVQCLALKASGQRIGIVLA